MKRSILSMAALALLVMTAMGQQRVIWTGQQTTKMQSVLYDTLGNRTDTVLWEIEILHCQDGKDSVATRVAEEGKQTVYFEYNEQRDLVARSYVLEDGRELEFTWSYKYDEAGRIVEETAFDAEGKLIAQYIVAFREDGQTEMAVCFVNLVNDFAVWTRYYHDQGYKFEDVRYFSQANGFFHFNWKERRFYEKPDVFAARPGADMYQRYTYQYTNEGRLLRTRLYDQKRRNLEVNRYYWNAELQLRSLESLQPDRDSLKVIWDFRYDHQGRQFETNIYTNETGKIKRYDYEYEYRGGQLAKESRYYIGEISVHRTYGKHKELLKETWKDLGQAKINELIFKANGQINKTINFRYGEVPYEQIFYSYE